MNTSDAREQRANEEIDLQLEYERVTKQRYEDFQEWLNKCPLVESVQDKLLGID